MDQRLLIRLEMVALLLVLLAGNVAFAGALVAVVMGVSVMTSELIHEGTYTRELPEFADAASALSDGLNSAVVPVVVVMLAVQVGYAVWRVEPGNDLRAQASEAPDLANRLRRLAAQADVPAPEVRVLDSEMSNSFTVGRASAATVYVTSALRDRLTAGELDAVLAHELAHVKNRDVTVTTLASSAIYLARATFYAMVGYFFLWGIAFLAVPLLSAVLAVLLSPFGLWDPALEDTLMLVCIALSASALCLALAASPFLLLDRFTRRFSITREYAADAAASELVGGPAPLAGALDRLATDEGTPRRDLRDAWSHVKALCVVSLPEGDDGAGDIDMVGDDDETGDDETGDDETGDEGSIISMLLLPAYLVVGFVYVLVILLVFLVEILLVIPVEMALEAAVDNTLDGAHPPVDDRIDRLQALGG